MNIGGTFICDQQHDQRQQRRRGGGSPHRESRWRCLSATVVGNVGTGGGDPVRGTATGNVGTASWRATAKDAAGTHGRAAAMISQGYNLIGTGTGCPSAAPAHHPDRRARQRARPDAGRQRRARRKTHNLVPGSPAIDRIPIDRCTLSNDQRGVTRPQNGKCDIGAVEYTATPPSPSPSPSPSIPVARRRRSSPLRPAPAARASATSPPPTRPASPSRPWPRAA